jgi:hypothetical protein
MIYELNSAEFFKVNHLFNHKEHYTPVFAILNSEFPGRVFVDNKTNPQWSLVWATSRWAYIEGNLESLSQFNDLIQQIVVPSSKKIKMNWFELYVDNNSKSMNIIENCFKKFESNKHYESIYVWDKSKYSFFRSNYDYPYNLKLEQVNVPLIPLFINDSAFKSEEIKYKTSVGFRLSLDNSLIAECKSNGFVNGNDFMIEVNTFDSNNREKGYGTAATVSLLDYCIEMNKNPLWETTEDNLASQQLAKKLGFVKKYTYPVYAIEF